jgi:hypothetical protein
MDISPEEAKMLLARMDSETDVPTEKPEDESLLSALGSMFKMGFEPYGAAAGGVTKGLLKSGRAIGESEAKLIDYLAGTQFAGKAPRVELPEAVQSLMERYPIASGIGEISGETLPLMAIPESAFGKIEFLEPYIQELSKFPQMTARLGGRFAKGMAVGAPLESLLHPEEDLSTSLKRGTAFGAVGVPVERVVSKVLDAPKYLSKMLGGKPTKELLERIEQVEKARGVRFPYAEYADSPGAKRLQKTVLEKMPFAGMGKATTEVGNVLQSQLANMLEEIKPKVGSAGSIVKDEIQEKYDTLNDIASDKYSRVYALLKRSNPEHESESLIQEAKSIKNKIEGKSRLGAKSLSEFNELKPVIEALDKNPVKNISDAFEFDKIVNQRMRNSKDATERKYLSDIKNAHDKDLQNTVKRSGSDDINSAYNLAKQYYKKIFVPYRDNPEISKILSEKTRPDDVVDTFFKTSRKKGKGDILESVTPHLSQDAKNAVVHEHLTTQLEEGKNKVTPTINKYGEIQKKQKDLLMNPEHRSLLDDIKFTKDSLGTKPFNKLFVEETGASLQPYAATSMLAGLGNLLGGIPGAIAAVPAGILAGRKVTKGLMGDTLREGLKRRLAAEKSPEVAQIQKIPTALGLLLSNQNSNQISEISPAEARMLLSRIDGKNNRENK